VWEESNHGVDLEMEKGKGLGNRGWVVPQRLGDRRLDNILQSDITATYTYG
jgi:hypothetical protein